MSFRADERRPYQHRRHHQRPSAENHSEGRSIALLRLEDEAGGRMCAMAGDLQKYSSLLKKN